MRVYVVIYGSIDAPEYKYGAYSSREKADERLKVVAKLVGYDETDNYTGLWIDEFELDVDVNPDDDG